MRVAWTLVLANQLLNTPLMYNWHGAVQPAAQAFIFVMNHVVGFA
jgi:hypothetical protein